MLVEEHSAVRVAILRFLATGLLVLLVVSIPMTFWVRSVAKDLALGNVLELTQRLADYAIQPMHAPGLIAGDRAVIEQIDARLAPWASDNMILRIKVWNPDGTILYSDTPELIGSTFELESWAQELLEGGPGVVTMETQNESENVFEAGSEELVEVYVASGTDTDHPLLFEMYYDAAVVHRAERHVLLGMVPVFLVTMGALQAAQLIPAVALAKRVQRHQRARRALLQQAIEAGEGERRRLARILHDDVIQDLAGLAYALEAMPPSGGAVAPSPVLQGSIAKLRDVTSELYSPQVGAARLPAALAVLVERTRSQRIRTVVNIDEPLVFGDDQATALYRIAREAMVNIMKHSNARNMQLELKREGKMWRMLIADDGDGFISTSIPEGGPEHFGLRMMSDAAEMVGARLEVSTTPGGGTSVTATISST